MNPGPTAALAEFAAEARFDALPSSVVDDTRRAVLDWLGSVLGGSQEPPAVMAREVVRGLGTSDDATVFGGARAAAACAALANGVASHILELDDVHKGSTLHAAAPIIPAALAVAERERSSGRDFLLAVAVGYDVALRVGEAVNPSHYRHWHPTGTAATFGAAAAAGVLLGLDAHAMRDALGSAGTQASGLWEFNADGAMSKHLHPGKAAMNGILAADLARAGFTGASRILEGERGFFRATSTGADESRITDALGRRWKVSENCYKLHSCCGHTHTAIDVSLDHRTEAGWHDAEALQAIARIEIDTYASGYEIVKEMNPRTPYQGKFSLAYVVCAALLDGVVGLDQFDASRFSDSGVRHSGIAELLARTTVRVSPDITSRYPAEWGTRVTLVHRDGSTRVRRAACPRGNPENAVSTGHLEAKARALVLPRFGETGWHNASQWLEGLLEARDLRAYTLPLAEASSLARVPA